jgi:hypothetical protein
MLKKLRFSGRSTLFDKRRPDGVLAFLRTKDSISFRDFPASTIALSWRRDS